MTILTSKQLACAATRLHIAASSCGKLCVVPARAVECLLEKVAATLEEGEKQREAAAAALAQFSTEFEELKVKCTELEEARNKLVEENARLQSVLAEFEEFHVYEDDLL